MGSLLYLVIMSALQAVRGREHGKHVLLLEGGGGAGDEDSRGAVASDGGEDYLVASGGDSRF